MTFDLGALRRRLGPSGVIEDEAERRNRSLDLWPQALGRPQVSASPAVLLPADEEQVRDCLLWAKTAGVPLAVRGTGSGVVGAAIPDAGAVVLDCSRLVSRLQILEGPDPIASMSAGWRGDELERRLGAMGWALRHVPQSLDCSSVGGWLAHDGFGQLSTRYGGVRRQTVGIRVAGLDGTVTAPSPDLHLGAEGTLGVITEAALRIRPLPKSRRFFSWTFGGPAETAEFARLLAAADPPPSVLRAFGPVDRLIGRFGHGHGGSRLKGAVERLLLGNLRFLRALTPLAGQRWTLIAIYEDEAPFGGNVPEAARLRQGDGEEAARRWWEHRFSPDAGRLRRIFAQGCFGDTADLWAPYGRMERIDAAVSEAVAPYAFTYSHLSHFNDEGACLYTTLAGAGGPAAHEAAWRAALDACVAAGGGVNHHHGFGRAKRPWLAGALSPERLGKLASAKRAADPSGTLNPWLTW